jgi:decaprenylphospho-beta-D-ribofuranose 2-oxidase
VKAALRSFDGTEVVSSDLRRPDRSAALRAELSEPGWVARGAGLSYCAAGLGPRTIDAGRFDRLLSFDESSGLLTVEAGAALGKIFAFAAPRGFYLPVMPGHPSITIGGCLAANVHGKNQCREGNFAETVERFTLFHPDRGEVLCDRGAADDVFNLTAGGFGLTGFISSVTLRLKKIPSETFLLERIPVRSYEESAEVMRRHERASSLYSWHQPGGRGFVFVSEPVPGRSAPEPRWNSLDASRGARGFSWLNRFTSPLALSAYELFERLGPSRRTVTLAEACFPVSGREFYFSLFGARGFREYQLLVPSAAFPAFCREFAALRAKHATAITLSSLKLFSGKQRYLNFEGEGVALALDAPEGAAARALWDGLDAAVAGVGGTVNAVKDSRLTAASARKLFPQYDGFRQALARWDPKRRVDSALRRRLEL